MTTGESAQSKEVTLWDMIKPASIVSAPWWSYLLWFISASPPLFLPGPQLWRRSGERERWLLRSRQERCGTSDTLSLASSSASPPPPPPPSGPAVTVAPIRLPSTGLQMHSRPWLPSRLELDGQTLAVSSVEEHETETSLKLSPPVTGSSFCKDKDRGSILGRIFKQFHWTASALQQCAYQFHKGNLAVL